MPPLLQADHRKPTLDRISSRRGRRALCAQPRVFFGDRGCAGRKSTGSPRCDAGAAARHPQRRVARPANRCRLPGRVGVPMTEFARKVLSGLPDSNVAGTTNNYTTLQEFTADSDKGGVKVDFQLRPTASVFARYGMRNLTTEDQPNIPLPSGGAGNGLIYVRSRQAVFGATWTPTVRRSGARFGIAAEAGKDPPRSDGARSISSARRLPSDSRSQAAATRL